jgi:hypothetical protein
MLRIFVVHLVLYIFKIADKNLILGAFEKLRKATVNFVVTVRMKQLGSH